MKTRKATVAVIATLSLVASLAACSTDAPAEDGAQELLVWDTGILGRTLENGDPDLENSFIDRMAVAFEDANPGVDVTVVQQGGDITSAAAQFQAASIAGDGPDIRIQYAGGPTISFGDFFTDLDPLLGPEVLDNLAGVNVNREGFSADGALLGMPFGAGNLFTVFQNHEILEAAGLDPADTPESWEELMENGQQVVDNTDKSGFWVANLEGYVGAWMISALVGGELGETAFTQMYAGEIPVDDPATGRRVPGLRRLGRQRAHQPRRRSGVERRVDGGLRRRERCLLPRGQLGEQQHARGVRRRGRELILHPDA